MTRSLPGISAGDDTITEMYSPEKIEEIMQNSLGPKWRWMAESYLNYLKNPTGRADESGGTFKRQEPYVQKKIRWFYLNLCKEERAKLSSSNLSFETLLKKIGLHPGSLTTEDLFSCFDDMQVEVENQVENDFGNFLLSMAWPETFPLFQQGVRPVHEQAAAQELQVIDVARERNVYVGMVAGIDSHRLLLRYANSKAFVVNFWDLPPTPTLPTMNAQVEVKFKHGQIVDFKFKNVVATEVAR